MVAVGTVNPLSLRLGRFDSYTAHQFWEGYLAPPLKGSYEYPLKEQKTKFSKYVWYFQANLILKKKFKTWSGSTNLQKTVYSKT